MTYLLVFVLLLASTPVFARACVVHGVQTLCGGSPRGTSGQPASTSTSATSNAQGVSAVSKAKGTTRSIRLDCIQRARRQRSRSICYSLHFLSNLRRSLQRLHFHFLSDLGLDVYGFYGIGKLDLFRLACRQRRRQSLRWQLRKWQGQWRW
jgi:hypothetical protein